MHCKRSELRRWFYSAASCFPSLAINSTHLPLLVRFVCIREVDVDASLVVVVQEAILLNSVTALSLERCWKNAYDKPCAQELACRHGRDANERSGR